MNTAQNTLETHGIPTTCDACKQSIITHFENGEWVGCVAINGAVPFKLVPLRRATDMAGTERRVSLTTDLRSTAHDRGHIASTRNDMRRGVPVTVVEHKKVVYAYQLNDARRNAPRSLTQTQADVFNVLKSHCVAKPLPVTHIAALAKHPVETTRVALNQFLGKKLATRVK